MSPIFRRRFRRSSSRESNRKSSFNRTRLPVHDRLSTRPSKSIERKNYDSDDYHARKIRRSRSNSKSRKSRNFRKSRSPRRRSKSSKRSRSRRRIRYSRSRSKEKFTFSTNYLTDLVYTDNLSYLSSVNNLNSNENGNYIKSERFYDNSEYINERRNYVDYPDQELSLIDSHNSLMDNFYNNNDTNLDRPIRERMDINPYTSTIEPEYYSKNKDLQDNYFNKQDIDLRNEKNYIFQTESSYAISKDKINEIKKCPNYYLGCNYSSIEDSMQKHLFECTFSPKNIKSFCNKCKLNVAITHDCLIELKNENYKERTKTLFFENTIKLSNSSLINDLTQQFIFVHYKLVSKKIKVDKNDIMDYITKQAVEAIFSTEDLIRLNKTDKDFQLVCCGLNTFMSEVSFNKSLKLQIPGTEEIHLQLIDKTISLKISMKNLFYENEQIIVAVPDYLTLKIEQTKKIKDLKNLITEKLNFSVLRLFINGKQYNDHQVLLCINISTSDIIEIEK